MSELEGMAQMARLEIEVGEKALKYSIDVFKFGISTIKKIAMFFAGLKYAKNKGLTNMDNLIQKTNGNTQLLQIPDELQKDFEEFCKKHGILISKMYDLNLKDGKKQYAIDANMADLAFNQFAILAVEKYKGNTQAETYKAQMEIFGMELKAEYNKLDEAKMLLERMRHGMPENETDALAKALGYENADDTAFLGYMENKYGEVTMEAYEKEAEAYCERLEDSVDWKEKEFANAQGKYEAELDKIKNPVTAITWEDYINSNKCGLDEFEEITKRMAHGKDDGSYQKADAAETFDKNTVDIPETRTDHSYCPNKPDIAIKRSYSPEYDENGRIKGCSHILECEVDGKKLTFDDKGLYGRAYQEGLEDFLKEAGLSMEDKFVTIEDERAFEKCRSVDKEIQAEDLKKNMDETASFQELSERMKENVKDKGLAFNKKTEKAYKRDGYYYCCAREDPYNYIQMKSEVAKDLRGKAYTKTEYTVFCGNEKQGTYSDQRVPGWNAKKWIELRDLMIEEAGLPEDDMVTFYSEKEFRAYQKAYERDVIGKAGEQKTSEKGGQGERSPLEEELDKRHNASMERKQSERAQRLKNRDYVYTIPNPKQDVFFVKGDSSILRANVPLPDGRGNDFCIAEFGKDDILRNKDGSYSVYFNQQDVFKIYSYDEIGNDGTLNPSASPRMLRAEDLKNSTYAAVNFKERQNSKDHMGMEQKGMDIKENAKMRKQV